MVMRTLPLRLSRRLMLRATAIAASAAVLPAQAQDPARPEQVLRGNLAATFEIFRRNQARGLPQSLRNSSNGALAALYLGQETSEAEALLRHVMAYQVVEASASPNRSAPKGAFPWDDKQTPTPNDFRIGTSEFATQAWGPILLGYLPRFDADFQKLLRYHAGLAIFGLESSVVDVNYTNIYLINVTNRLLMAQALNDTVAFQNAKTALTRWINHVGQVGIHEFDSPTYYGADLNALTSAYRFTTDKEVCRLLSGILSFFWADIAANSFAGHLSGPHSRDYDFAGGIGAVNFYMSREGLSRLDESDTPNFENIYPLIDLAPGGYRPDSSLLGLARQLPRTVTSLWGNVATRRTNVIDTGYSLGCINAGRYDAQDKLLVATLSDRFGDALPNIAFIPERVGLGSRAPQENVLNNHRPSHLPLELQAEQDDSLILAMMTINPTPSKSLWDTRPLATADQVIRTTLLLPTGATALLVNEIAIAPGMKIPANAVFTVWSGTAVVVLRIFRLQGVENISIESDPIARHLGILRCLLSGPSRPAAQQIGVMMFAQTCESITQAINLSRQVRDAAILETMSDGSWSARCDLGSRDVGIAQPASIRSRSAQLRAQPPALAVNGRSFVSLLTGA